MFLILFILLLRISTTSTMRGFGDNMPWFCPSAKFGNCPLYAINPSVFNCSSNADCKGTRLCCLTDEGKKCSDPEGSNTNLRCSKFSRSFMPKVECYTDSNCASLKCCLSDDECISYCEIGIPSCYNVQNKHGTCPTPIPTTGRECTNSDDCPRNQICCTARVDQTGTCADPTDSKGGTCPTPDKMNLFTKSCNIDQDCDKDNELCCRFNDCTYRCVTSLGDEDKASRETPLAKLYRMCKDNTTACLEILTHPNYDIPRGNSNVNWEDLFEPSEPAAASAPSAPSGAGRSSYSGGGSSVPHPRPAPTPLPAPAPAPIRTPARASGGGRSSGVVEFNPAAALAASSGGFNSATMIGEPKKRKTTTTTTTTAEPTTEETETEATTTRYHQHHHHTREKDFQSGSTVCKRKNSFCPGTLFESGARCSEDANCPGIDLCCFDTVKKRHFCHKPFGEKPGNCPNAKAITKVNRTCTWDANCPDKKKCCGGNGCAFFTCINPAKEKE